jgi:hypothetical protein
MKKLMVNLVLLAALVSYSWSPTLAAEAEAEAASRSCEVRVVIKRVGFIETYDLRDRKLVSTVAECATFAEATMNRRAVGIKFYPMMNLTIRYLLLRPWRSDLDQWSAKGELVYQPEALSEVRQK